VETRTRTPESSPKSRVGTRVLARRAADSGYSTRLAQTPADLTAAQTLRFQVFNLELSEGLEQSFLTGRDADRFDEVCEHLLVESHGEIVGTYRMQTGRKARESFGFYSACEFDFGPLEPIFDDSLELGRACVAKEHRNLTVLGMLWRGIAQYARAHGCRYLIGCSSLTSQDPLEGASLYASLPPAQLVRPELRTQPKPEYLCPLNHVAPTPVRLPKLLAAYLSIGAQICSPPAIDREFGTIDFLTLLDLEALPENARSFLD
jgi:putative hemolysin